MPEKSWALRKPSVAGLFFRIGKYSWFWGWGTPAAASSSPSATPPRNPVVAQAEWSNVAQWLRHMHAQADLPSADSTDQKK